MHATGPGSRKEQGGADQLGVVGVEYDMVGHALEPGPLDGHAAIAGAVGQLVEQLGQVGGRRLGRAGRGYRRCD